jgi:hypothetical protein
MPDKRLVFIVSGGRTGTKFFAVQLGRLFDDVLAVHEPDTLSTSFAETAGKIRTFGFRHMIVDRLLGRTGIRQLSEAFLSKELSADEAVRCMQAARKSYYALVPHPTIIESNYAWYGLVTLLGTAFDNVKVLSIVRDPRDWVRSQMNWGSQFGARDWAYRFGFGKLNPARLGDTEYAAAWSSMGRFSRLCWLWRTIYNALNDASRLPFVHTERYEDLFLDAKNLLRLKRTLEFLFDEGGREIPPLESTFVRERIHGNLSYTFPRWQEWTNEQASQLQEICGALMQEYGYGGEPEWRSLLEGPGRD